jgi:diguanylate cyclase (GGDEF)-like protein
MRQRAAMWRSDQEEPVQNPRPAERATGSASTHTRFAAERRRADALEARVLELESARDQLQMYAEDLRRTHAELRRWIASLNALHDVSTSISAALDEELVLERLLESLAQLVPSESAAVYLSQQPEPLHLRASDGRALRIDLAESARWSTTALGRSLLAALERGDTAGTLTAEEQGEAALSVPLRSRGQTLGLLLLLRDASTPYTAEEQRLVKLVASVVGVALENARLYQETQRLATVDPLTELFNYRYFHQTLSLEVARAKRHGYALAVLMADLDHFKRVNDTYGHPKGDELLREVARAASAQLRRTDVLARLGGEEFGVILPGSAYSAVAIVAEKLRAAVGRVRVPSGLGRDKIRITISVGGVSVSPADAEPRSLVNRADQALLRAKQAGRNRVVIEDGEEQDGQANGAAGGR